MRAPFQVLVFPYRVTPDREILYAVFRREQTSGGYWQGIAGGGEAEETILKTAQRETFEESGILPTHEFIQLDTCSSIPVTEFPELKGIEDLYVIPEYCFGVKVEDPELKLSEEHTEYRWLSYSKASQMLQWDSNKTAL
jgi:dihydroneopterin triphosphate diphosphatase